MTRTDTIAHAAIFAASLATLAAALVYTDHDRTPVVYLDKVVVSAPREVVTLPKVEVVARREVATLPKVEVVARREVVTLPKVVVEAKRETQVAQTREPVADARS